MESVQPGRRNPYLQVSVLPCIWRGCRSPIGSGQSVRKIVRDSRTLQGMARVWSGQAPAWPLVSGRRRHRGSAVNGGRSPFPEETRSAIDGGGVPPHTERAIPGPKREYASVLSRLPDVWGLGRWA